MAVTSIGKCQSYLPSFETEEDWAHMYAHLEATLESYETGNKFPFTLEQWKGSTNLDAFDLSSDLVRDRSLRLKFRLSAALPYSIQVIAYELFGELFEVNVARETSMPNLIIVMFSDEIDV